MGSNDRCFRLQHTARMWSYNIWYFIYLLSTKSKQKEVGVGGYPRQRVFLARAHGRTAIPGDR